MRGAHKAPTSRRLDHIPKYSLVSGRVDVKELMTSFLSPPPAPFSLVFYPRERFLPRARRVVVEHIPARFGSYMKRKID